MSTDKNFEQFQQEFSDTPLVAQAGQLHEVYEAQIAAGFNPQQSLYLVGCVLTGSPGPAPDGVPPDPNA